MCCRSFFFRGGKGGLNKVQMGLGRFFIPELEEGKEYRIRGKRRVARRFLAGVERGGALKWVWRGFSGRFFRIFCWFFA